MGVASTINRSVERIFHRLLGVEHQHVVHVKPQVETHIREVLPMDKAIQTTIMIATVVGHVTVTESKTVLLHRNAVAEDKIGVQHTDLKTGHGRYFLLGFYIQGFEFAKEMYIAPNASVEVGRHAIQEMLEES